MDKKQILETLKEELEDAFISVEAVKGREFADLVRLLHMFSHTFELISLLTEGQSKENMTAFANQYAMLAELAMHDRIEKLPKEDQTEVFRWAEIVEKKVHSATQELNK